MKKYIKTNWNETTAEDLDPKLSQRVFRSQNVMVVKYTYEPGLEFPEHSHPQEQVTIIEKGHLLFIIDGEKVEMKAGDVCAIPPNVPHSTIVLGDEHVESISIFTPIKDRIIIER